MKVALVFLAVVAVALSAYTNKWDNIDVDKILGNDRLLKGYVNCLMDKGRCTPEGKDLKENLPDALASDCEKCTDIQKEKSLKIIKFLVNQRKDLWDDLATKYDPNDEYRKKYQDQAKEKGIEI